MARYKTNELRASNRGVRAFLENSKFSHALLKVVAVFGVSLIMADGILTPAQSVLGAIQGTAFFPSAKLADKAQDSLLLTPPYLSTSSSARRAAFSSCCLSCSPSALRSCRAPLLR
jgi:hypothetical protein